MPVKIAILDLYNGQPNQGMRCIQDILVRYAAENQLNFQFNIFPVRDQNILPGTDHDIYISSGGPGSPLETEESWETSYFDLIDKLHAINQDPASAEKKHVFFICHSFQLICRHYKLGNLTKRHSTSFGIFPIYKTEAGRNEDIFDGLKDPFYIVDSRDYQVISPDEEKMKAMGAQILALEKERPHVPYERCLMAIRFNEYFFGTQFHPEADPVGMREYLLTEEKKKTVIEIHGEEKYKEMMALLEDPEILEHTQSQILPSFLDAAINALQEA